jgi:hypothetical protein
MAESSILLANGKRIGTETETDDNGDLVHLQRIVTVTQSTAGGTDPGESLFTHFTLDGAGVSNDMAVNGASVAQSFRYIVPTAKVARIARICGHMIHLTGAWAPNTFGSLSELANGCIVRAVDSDDSVLEDFTDGDPITSNAEWSDLLGPDAFVDIDKAKMIPFRWTLTQAYTEPLILTAGQYMEILIQDNLSAIDEWHLMIQGKLVDA